MLEFGLMEALNKAVQSEPDISEHLSGIFCYVPPEVKPPYIRVQVKQDMSIDQKFIYGDIEFIVVSRYRGQLEMSKLLNTLQKILSRPLITVQGHQMIFKEENLQLKQNADNLTQSATISYRIKLRLNLSAL